ncbi:PREDICTED: steroid hormone receptor ERR1-like [Priapulus caudatus]|uniref:Steroid hormone receptor ERR1-like n=1 Tax=Priapulus caudatus TaxID=37621 RepID=A0ABM1EJW5_PRICU|nr:PREDICTED: steroid hormone receptor ERR1-like [Priapulus caudatus]
MDKEDVKPPPGLFLDAPETSGSSPVSPSPSTLSPLACDSSRSVASDPAANSRSRFASGGRGCVATNRAYGVTSSSAAIKNPLTTTTCDAAARTGETCLASSRLDADPCEAYDVDSTNSATFGCGQEVGVKKSPPSGGASSCCVKNESKSPGCVASTSRDPSPPPLQPQPETAASHAKFSAMSPTSTVDNSLEGRDDLGPRRLCLVCGDVASGLHYSVASCEACKAFFKRTIQGGIEYICPSGGSCEISKQRRKACQACRYQKCLRVGMLREGVRLDRVRGGRRKYQDVKFGDGCKLPTYYNAGLPQQMAIESSGETFLRQLNAIDCNERLYANVDSNQPEGLLRTLSAMSDISDRMLSNIINWAKRVPGFKDLALTDQMLLLQAGWGELIVLKIMYLSMPYQGHIKLCEDLCMDIEVFRAINSEEMYPVMLKFLGKFGSKPLTKDECVALNALVLFNCGEYFESTS